MTNSINEIVKIVSAILPFVLLCIASKKVNLPKADRSKQFAMPIIGLVYALGTMIWVNSINEGLLKLINNIPKWITSLADFKWMPSQISAFLDKIAKVVTDFLANLNLNFWIFFLSNLLILLVYMTVKDICLKIIAKSVKPDDAIHTKISGMFYEYFPERNKWCIKENYVQVRNMFKVFYYTAITLSTLLMILSCKFYLEGLLKAVFYPVFGIIIVGELYFYLDGATKREYSNDILGEDEDAYKVVNYSMLRKFLRSVFGDKLLTENTSINNSLNYDVTTEDIVHELENSEDPKVSCFATYVDTLHKTGFKVDHNYLNSSLDMLNGKSVLFNNPFYNDLIPYAFYPMNRALLSHQKVLVVLGRHSIEDDIKEWLEKGIEAVTNIPFLWNIGILNSEEQDVDIGIVTRSDVLDIELHNANSQFLENVGFVVIIEPSKLISTAQIGLNLLVKKCRTEEDKNIVYCMCDKNCDGLVDAMSHVLMTNITEVSATKKHLGTSSYMCWEADKEYLHHRLVPNISRYLGMGTELSFAALKNQVSKTKWYGGEAFPVADIRWIDRQYYYDLTKYAGLSTTQETMDEHFITTSNFWSAEVDKNNYLTVEDEANNMFEILRNFSTRTTEQGFINIISSEYLLKDYMADNASIFEADAKAIPYIVADYTRSNRNTILRLILMMSTYPVSADVLEKELSLLGTVVFDLKKQLWFELYNCYSKISNTIDLSNDYSEAVDQAYERALELGGSEWTSDIIQVEKVFSLKSGGMETMYSITDPRFLAVCVSELRSAGYVAEDEKGMQYYLGAELGGHIYQKYLPGQFFTFGGKYYEMQHLTADGQVLVRRAADHITGRPAYRQIRKYVIQGTKPSEKIGAQQDVAGMKVIKEFADISVDTSGYYRMERYNDFTTAKKILFEGSDKNKIKQRVYRNKEILRVELPDFDGKLDDNIRYTITVLFNEIFKTIFAENQAFICALTDDSFLSGTTDDKPLTYSIKGEGCELKNNAIYIVEDSQLDLGLLVAVERNLERIFDIIYDYLDWHKETLEASLNPPADPVPPIVFATPEEIAAAEAAKKKGIKGFFGGIADKIKGWFKKKPKKGETPDGEVVPIEDTPVENPTAPEDTPTENPTTPEGETKETPAEKKAKKKLTKQEKKEQKEKAKQEKKEQKEKAKQEKKEQKEKAKQEKKAKKEQAKKDKKANKEKPKKEKKAKKDKPNKEKKGIFGWLFGWLKRKPEPAEETPVEEEVVTPEDVVDDVVTDEETADTEEILPEEGVEKELAEATEAPPFNEYGHSSESAKAGFSTDKKPYHERYYMLYGKESESSFIDLSGTLKYLSKMGMERNSLKQARMNKDVAEFVEATFKPGKPDARYCDFCGTEIYGVEYETLADGRDRCLNCGRTAIKTEKEFRKIFEDVRRNMEAFYGIRINAGIRVEMVNSKTLHKRLGKAFIPTRDSDGRTIGVAIKDKSGYSLYIENGSPRMASMLTMVHELTHIWQYINWNDKAIRKKYGKDMRIEIYEGMAKWVEIQYAYLINEPAVAKREELITSYRDDVYGHGFLRYHANYPFSMGTVITKPTPFMNLDTPLDPEFCGPFTVVLPTDGVNPGDISRKDPTPSDDTPTYVGSIEGERERDPDSVNRYAYSRLTNMEKPVYDAVLQAINNFDTEITTFDVPVTNTQIQKIVDYVQRDHPEIFWFQHGATFFFDTATNIVNRLELKYCMTKEEAKKRQEKIDTATKSFLTSVNDSMSDYEVVLHIYENIIKLVDYDSVGLERQKAAVSAETPDDLRSIYGVFVNKKAVCSGYAKAMQYLLNMCGIECIYVTSKKHAWNIVKLEGDYYHVDVTWGDGSNTDKTKGNMDFINYDCFCLTTAEAVKLDMHIPDDDFPLPECTATKCNYHRRHGLYFEAYNFDKIRYVVCESVKYRKMDVSFKFSTPEVFNEAKKSLIDEGKFREAIQYAALKTDVKIDSGYTYSFANDKLTIALFMNKL